MNFLNNLSNKLAEVKGKVRSRLDSLKAPQEIIDSRRAICNSCEFLFEPTMQCKKCGCFIQTTTHIAQFSCPLNKWSAVPGISQAD